MSYKFPEEFDKHLTLPNLRGAFLSDLKSPHPRSCKNCGGVGTLILFLATGGPFQSVPTGTCHFHKDRWWTGKHIEEACPICKGSGIDPDYKEQPIRQRTIDFKEIIK